MESPIWRACKEIDFDREKYSEQLEIELVTGTIHRVHICDLRVSR